MDNTNTKTAIKLVSIIAETIRDLKEVPSGHLYAGLMGSLTLDQYQTVIGILERTNLITVDSSHLIRWVGPSPEQK